VDSHWPLTIEAQNKPQTSLRGIYGEQISTGTGFLQVALGATFILVSYSRSSEIVLGYNGAYRHVHMHVDPQTHVKLCYYFAGATSC